MVKKSILLTGGSGFVGRNILEQLGSKYNIYAPTSNELDLEDSDATQEYLKSNDFDLVIHAANWGGTRKKNDNLENSVEKNLKFFFNLVRCKEHFGKLIQLGSGAEYDRLHIPSKVKEDYFDKFVPLDPYGFYKYVCSKYIQNADNIINLRIFGCYGKYEDYEIRFISNAICKAVFDLPITITNKNVVFDYLYIDDFVKIINYFIGHDVKHKFYNTTPNQSIDLLTIAKKINEVSGKNLEIIVKNSGMGPEYSGDNSLLKKEINDLKFTSLDDGIRRLYAWYDTNKKLIDYDKISVDRY